MARPMPINLIESSDCDFQVNNLHFLLPADKEERRSQGDRWPRFTQFSDVL